MYALDPTLRVDLLGLSLSCHSVVCCRVSPLQKAQVNNISWSTTFLLPTEELTVLHFVGNKPTHTGQKRNECFFTTLDILLINIHYTMDALTTLVGLYSLAYCVHSCTSEFWAGFSDVWSFCYQLSLSLSRVFSLRYQLILYRVVHHGSVVIPVLMFVLDMCILGMRCWLARPFHSSNQTSRKRGLVGPFSKQTWQ
jgi:hypothetical protein